MSSIGIVAACPKCARFRNLPKRIVRAAEEWSGGFMSIRTRIFGPGADDPLLPAKRPKGAQPDTLNSIAIARTESRRGNARSGDRHRLKAELATLRHEGIDHQVEGVNVSGGGAMARS